MLEHILDDSRLDGPHSALITYRPRRSAVAVCDANNEAVLAVIEQECQVWGGANTPLVVGNSAGIIAHAYLQNLAGSQVDYVHGLVYNGIYHLAESKLSYSSQTLGWGRALNVSVLDYHMQSEYLPVEIPVLAAEDPWRSVYTACLGSLPEELDSTFLYRNRMPEDLNLEDFVEVKRPLVEGSMDDLLARLSDDAATSPRKLAMNYLAYGSTSSTAIRFADPVLPEPEFQLHDAGPNVIVVCTPGDAGDTALLWNMRAAHRDQHVLPIGIPASKVSLSDILKGAHHQRVSRNGMSRLTAYVTSSSLTVDELRALVPDSPEDIAFVEYGQLLTLGHAAGWSREEVLVWDRGRTSVIPTTEQRHRAILSKHRAIDHIAMMVDVSVPSFPFPDGRGLCAEGLNWNFAAGSATRGVGRRSSEAVELDWPSRLLSARVAMGRRDLAINESEPGRAALLALSSFTGTWEIAYLAHAPLLKLLEEMAARQGMNWYKSGSSQMRV